MRSPRWLVRALAWAGGWFWLPCPKCGRMFAGFEDGGGILWDIQVGTGHILRGRIMCPRHPDDENRLCAEGWQIKDAARRRLADQGRGCSRGGHMIRPFLKRDRWWVINEGVLYDILKKVEGPPPSVAWSPFTADMAMVELLRDAKVERAALGEEP